MRWLDNITNSLEMNLSKLQDVVLDRGAYCAAVHGVTKNQRQLGSWTTNKRQEGESEWSCEHSGHHRLLCASFRNFHRDWSQAPLWTPFLSCCMALAILVISSKYCLSLKCEHCFRPLLVSPEEVRSRSWDLKTWKDSCRKKVER